MCVYNMLIECYYFVEDGFQFGCRISYTNQYGPSLLVKEECHSGYNALRTHQGEMHLVVELASKVTRPPDYPGFRYQKNEVY